MQDILKGKSNNESQKAESGSSHRPLIRRTTFGTNPAQSQSRADPPRLLIRRTTGTSDEGAPSQRLAPSSGQLLRRTTGSQNAGAPRPLLRRTSAPGTGSGQLLRRPAAPGGQRSGARPAPGQQKGPDKRRRRAVHRADGEQGADDGLDERIEENIAKYIDRPENPTEPITYAPNQMSLDELKVDWPNTPLTSAGLTESIVQKLRWLAKRLPHGYRSPQQLAQDLLAKKFVAFESEAEKQEVIKVAKELSAEFEQAIAEGTKKHSDVYNFHTASQKKGNFVSVNDQEGDNKYLIESNIQGSYAQPQKQPYPFMQNAARMLFNNGSYGPESSQKLLARVGALIPQRGAAAQQAQKAS